MSNDKPTATAVITFYQNKHVEVELSTIKGITPRTLSIAGHLLQKEYRGMKGLFIANEHRKAREAAKIDQEKIEHDAIKADKKEDKRLFKAATESIKSAFGINQALAEAEGKTYGDDD